MSTTAPSVRYKIPESPSWEADWRGSLPVAPLLAAAFA